MLDYLFIGAHSDDCEIFAGGTMLYLKSQGYKVGILDLTRGEMGSLGTPEIRKKEAEQAADFLGLDYRKILSLTDTNILSAENEELPVSLVIKEIRRTQPSIIFTFYSEARHPDHSQVHKIVKEAFFLSGLKKVLPDLPAHRAHNLIYFSDFPNSVKPSFVIDISSFFEKKIDLIKCYASQVKTDNTKTNDTTFIHSDGLWDAITGTNLYHGSLIGTKYGEGFVSYNLPKIVNPLDNFSRKYI